MNFNIRQYVKIQVKPRLKQSNADSAQTLTLAAWPLTSRPRRPGKSITSRNQTPLHTTHRIHSEPEIRCTGLIPCLLTRFTLKICVDQKIQEAWLLQPQAFPLWKENHFLLGGGFIQYTSLCKERSSLFGCQNIKLFRNFDVLKYCTCTVTITEKGDCFLVVVVVTEIIIIIAADMY